MLPIKLDNAKIDCKIDTKNVTIGRFYRMLS